MSGVFVLSLLPVFGSFTPLLWVLQSTALSAYYHVKIPFEKIHPCHIQPLCLFYQPGFLIATEITCSIFHAFILLPSKPNIFFLRTRICLG